MSTRGESPASVDGVLDVSVLVPACFENPLLGESTDFVSEVLLRRRKAVLPVSAVIGAYHVVTKYLGVSRLSAKSVLGGILETGSSALHPELTPRLASDALDYAASYGVESWDGYLFSLARSLGAPLLYSLDEELKKVKEVSVVNPFSPAKTQEYHSFLASAARKRLQ